MDFSVLVVYLANVASSALSSWLKSLRKTNRGSFPNCQGVTLPKQDSKRTEKEFSFHWHSDLFP